MNNIEDLLLQSPEYEVVDKLHTQIAKVRQIRLGDVIYWKMEGYKPKGSKLIQFSLFVNDKLHAKHIPSSKLQGWLELLKLEAIADQDY